MAWRHQRGRRGRNPKQINLPTPSKTSTFTPTNPTTQEPIIIELVEIEAQRLVDFEGLSQEEAVKQVGVSRGTI